MLKNTVVIVIQATHMNSTTTGAVTGKRLGSLDIRIANIVTMPTIIAKGKL